MRSVRAHDWETGEFVGIQSAGSKDESTRRSHEYRCLNQNCDTARFHWRKATRDDQNTVLRPSTFPRNSSTQHIDGCNYDFQGFVNRHRQVAYVEGDNLHLRLGFPIGGSPSDIYPWKAGMVSRQQREAAKGNLDKRPISSLRNLVDFVEKHWSGLEDVILDDLVLSYQGLDYGWRDLWVATNQYGELLKRQQEVQRQEKKESDPAFVVTELDYEMHRTRKGKRRFSALPQMVKQEGRFVEVRPIVVCETSNLADSLAKVTLRGDSLLVSSRPFSPDSPEKNKQNSHLYVAEFDQLARIDSAYCKPQRELSLTG